MNNIGICHAEIGENKISIAKLVECIKVGNSKIDGGGSPQAKEREMQKVAKVILNKAFVYLIMGYKEEAYDCIGSEFDDLLQKCNKPVVSMSDNFVIWLNHIISNFKLESRDLYIVALVLNLRNNQNLVNSVLDKAISNDNESTNSYLWYQKGNILLEEKNYVDAIRCYSRAIDVNPQMAVAHNNSAVAFEYLNDFEESRGELIKAIKANPSLTVAHQNLVRLTIHETKERQDFWQSWGSSKRK